jgi:hypothetical protein
VAAHRVEGLEDAEAALTQDGYDVVRVGFADLIGSERGRDVLVKGFARTVGEGLAFCRSVYGTTPMGDVVPIEGDLRRACPTSSPSRTYRPSGRSPGSREWHTASPTSTTPTGRRRR